MCVQWGAICTARLQVLFCSRMHGQPADPADSFCDRDAGCATCAACLQVFFCSRTHSQLTQVVGELKRTPFAHSLATVALASRKVSAPDLQAN